MTVIYIDVLFLINLFVNYFLLLAVKLISKSTVGRLRILLGAVIGSVYCCLMFYPSLQIIFSSFFKILFSLIAVLIVFGFKSLRSYAFKTVMFFAFTVFFGGIMLLIDIVFSPEGLIYNNGIVYIDVSPISLVLSSAVCYLIFSLCARFFPRRPSGALHRISIKLFDKTVSFYAVADSGNMLKDNLTMSSVIVADFEKIKALLPQSSLRIFETQDISNYPSPPLSERFALIPFSTVGGCGILPAFRPDEIFIDGKKADKKTIVAVEAQKLKHEEYSALISPELI